MNFLCTCLELTFCFLTPLLLGIFTTDNRILLHINLYLYLLSVFFELIVYEKCLIIVLQLFNEELVIYLIKYLLVIIFLNKKQQNN